MNEILAPIDPTLVSDRRKFLQESGLKDFKQITSLISQAEQRVGVPVDPNRGIVLSMGQAKQICKLVSTMEIHDSLDKIDSALKEQFESCTGDVAEVTATDSGWGYALPQLSFVPKTFKELGKLLDTPDKRAGYLKASFSGMGLKDLDQGELGSGKFATYRDMVEYLNELPCVKAIFVPQMQLLDLSKTVYRESDDRGGVGVVWGGKKCATSSR
jgi:hypothetical protein